MAEPMVEAPGSTFLDSLGPRSRRRAEPRTSIAIAGAGCALAILGVLIVAGDTGASDNDFNKVPGIVLSALVVGAGFFALSAVRQGAIATAGSVAAALGVPALIVFLTIDENSIPPYSTNGILIVSTVVWFGAYAVGPGRGRPFFLGAGLIGFWLTVLQLSEKVFDFPFGVVDSFGTRFEATEGGCSMAAPAPRRSTPPTRPPSACSPSGWASRTCWRPGGSTSEATTAPPRRSPSRRSRPTSWARWR